MVRNKKMVLKMLNVITKQNNNNKNSNKIKKIKKVIEKKNTYFCGLIFLTGKKVDKSQNSLISSFCMDN